MTGRVLQHSDTVNTHHLQTPSTAASPVLICLQALAHGQPKHCFACLCVCGQTLPSLPHHCTCAHTSGHATAVGINALCPLLPPHCDIAIVTGALVGMQPMSFPSTSTLSLCQHCCQCKIGHGKQQTHHCLSGTATCVNAHRGQYSPVPTSALLPCQHHHECRYTHNYWRGPSIPKPLCHRCSTWMPTPQQLLALCHS